MHRLSKLKSKISKSYEVQKKELQFVLPNACSQSYLRIEF
jgi:hypothetical protein